MSEAAQCPGCGKLMEKVVEPDLSFEKCPGCGGIFLDAGELNALATGMAGDVELCSVDPEAGVEDRFSARTCPRCPGSRMAKQHFLRHTELVFDYCPKCHGWFLDAKELDQTNAILNELRSGSAEYRGRHHGRLVTLVKVPVFLPGAAGPFGLSYSTTVDWDRVDAFFEKPLKVGLRVSPETWSGRLWRLLGASDVTTGDADFDHHFHVKAADEKGAVAALSRGAREAILHFVRGPVAKLAGHGRLEVLDDRIVFSFRDPEKELPEEERRALFDALAETAAAIDGGS